jgi:hypothetical protein
VVAGDSVNNTPKMIFTPAIARESTTGNAQPGARVWPALNYPDAGRPKAVISGPVGKTQS